MSKVALPKTVTQEVVLTVAWKKRKGVPKPSPEVLETFAYLFAAAPHLLTQLRAIKEIADKGSRAIALRRISYLAAAAIKKATRCS